MSYLHSNYIYIIFHPNTQLVQQPCKQLWRAKNGMNHRICISRAFHMQSYPNAMKVYSLRESISGSTRTGSRPSFLLFFFLNPCSYLLSCLKESVQEFLYNFLTAESHPVPSIIEDDNFWPQFWNILQREKVLKNKENWMFLEDTGRLKRKL